MEPYTKLSLHRTRLCRAGEAFRYKVHITAITVHSFNQLKSYALQKKSILILRCFRNSDLCTRSSDGTIWPATLLIFRENNIMMNMQMNLLHHCCSVYGQKGSTSEPSWHHRSQYVFNCRHAYRQLHGNLIAAIARLYSKADWEYLSLLPQRLRQGGSQAYRVLPCSLPLP